ncbi:MAG TPA: glycosyltransferase family 39 protein [Aggregatilineales bacterium]|nr:glycosyltransferase family 39 protein [Aggregatilineales bacterium]
MTEHNTTLQPRAAWRPRLASGIAVALLLIYFATRLYHLMALPFFLDEASHLTRAQMVWQGQPLYLLETGKALAPYLAALCWPFAGAPFIGRLMVVLLGAIGLASAYAVGRDLHSRRAGLLVMALWIVCPQLFFYERMALVDTTVSAMAMLALWLAIRAVRSGRITTAALCGIALALTVLAKLTGIVFAIIPVLVVLMVTSRRSWGIRIRAAIVAYIVLGLLLVGPFLYLRSTDTDPTGQEYGLTTTRLDDFPTRLAQNLARVRDAEVAYFSIPMLIIMVGAGLYGLVSMPRRALLLIGLAVVLVGAICFAGVSIWLRYVSPAAPFLLLCTALALINFADTWQDALRPVRMVFALSPLLVLAGWAVLHAIPFMLTAYSDPTALNLPNCSLCDETEYIRWIPSGYGVREAAQYIQSTMTTPDLVVGSAVNCNTARLMMPYDSPVAFKCYDLDWGGGNWNVIQDMQDQIDRAGHVYVLGENVAIVSTTQFPVPWCVVKSFPRPDPRYFVTLYYIGKGADDSHCPPSTEK